MSSRLAYDSILYDNDSDTGRRKSSLEDSPYIEDLVAEKEQFYSESTVRLAAEDNQWLNLKRRKEKVKNDVVLETLAEPDDVDMLREQKRYLLLEEKRIKALIDYEKALAFEKKEHYEAINAEKHRREDKLREQRNMKLKKAAENKKLRQEILRERLAVKEDNPFVLRTGKGVIGPLGGHLG